MTSRRFSAVLPSSRAPRVAGRIRSLPGQTLALALGLGFVLPPVVQGQVQQPLPSIASSGPIGSSSSLGVPGPQNCPDGNPPTATMTAGSFPITPNTLFQTDWITGVTPGVTPIAVPKFDPSLGSLVQVEISLSARIKGDMCADNPQAVLCPAQLSVGGTILATPSSTNTPPVTGVTQIPLNDSVILTPAGFLLGAADAFPNECLNGFQGQESDGSGTAGEDHVQKSWDALLPGTAQPPTVLSNSADLPPWVEQFPGDIVEFDTSVFQLASGSFCAALNPTISNDSAQVFIDVTYRYCPNSAPICGPDFATTDEGVPVEIDVLANDTDIDGVIECKTLKIAPGGGPSNGSAIVPAGCSTSASCPDPACRIVYTPNPGFCGVDTFTYVVEDDFGTEMMACQVTVTVNAVNEPPIANDDNTTTSEGVPVLIDVCANDSDPDDVTGCGDPLDCTNPAYNPFPNVQISTPDCGGNASSVFNGGRWQIRFDPPPGFCGVCTFTYTNRDTGSPALQSNLATVTVTVDPVNEAPVAVDDKATTNENTPVLIDICANDSDPDDITGCGAPLDCTAPGANPFTLVSGPSCGGNVSFVFNGGRWQARFDPPVNFCGACSFTYTVDDTAGLTSNVANVDVTVNAVNEPPIAVDDSATTDEGVPVLIDVCQNDSDPDDASGCGAPLDCTNPGYNPFPNVQISSPDCGGNASSVFNGGRWQIRFDPPADFCGVCTFTYTNRDTGKPALQSNVATVTVTVNPVNEPPVALDDSATTDEGVPVLIDVCANDSDPDDGTGCGDDLDCTNPGYNPFPNVQISSPDCGGTATSVFNGGRWQIRFDPPADFCGVCTFTYTARDTGSPALQSNVATVTVTVDPVNEPPVAQDDTATTPENTPVLIDVCANDSDPDDGTGCGAPLDCSNPGYNPFPNVQISDPDCGGSASSVFNGGRWQIRFDPPADFCGVCTFTYTARDTGSPALQSNVATVTVTVDPVNEAPVAVDDKGASPTGGPVLIDVCANDSDPDDSTGCGAPLDCNSPGNNPIQLLAQPACGTFAAVFNGGRWQVRYDPAPGFCGDCEIDYRISDTAGLASNVATIRVTVTLVNNPPVAVDDSATTDEGMPVQINVLANDSDPDSEPCASPLDPNSVTIVTPPDAGCGSVGRGPFPGGVVTFTPAPDFCGQCTFTYQVCDTNAKTPLCDTATVTVTVNAVNECPVAVDDVDNPDFRTPVDTPIDLDVCANDFDPDEGTGCGGDLDCTTVTIVSQPDCGGTAVVLADGRVRFTPPAGFEGLCCFTYVVSDDFDPPCTSQPAMACVEVFVPPCGTENRRAPGSLLLFPEFDNRDGIVSIFTVTNTGNREIQVEYVYREEETCQEFNRKEDLTGNDTLTLVTNFHNPNQDRGFVYVFAQCPESNKAVAYNKLIGQVLVVDGLETFSYGINAVSFEGLGFTEEAGGTPDAECGDLLITDVNGNGRRDLDGIEYAMAPDFLTFPRFMGQDDVISSELILVSLSGGAHFTSTLDFLIYNDNEEEFSREYAFTCWDRVPLLEISALFANDFLNFATNNDPNEVLGDPTMEAGWFQIDGDVAVSTAATIYDPAFYAVLVERVNDDRFVADLPFENCTQPNGSLLQSGTHGL